MALTIVMRRPASAEDATLFAVARGLALGSEPQHGCTALRIFRGYHDPTTLLWVADWQSEGLYDVSVFGPNPNAASDSNSAESPRCWYFSLGRSYGVMGRARAAAICGLIRAARGAGEATRALWSDGAGALRAVPSFAHWYVYSDDNDPDHFMTI